MTKPTPPWQTLLRSNDLAAELRQLYDDAFYGALAANFGREATPARLTALTQDVARAYLHGLCERAASKDGKRNTDGERILELGLAARRLRLALEELATRPWAEAMFLAPTRDALAAMGGRGAMALRAGTEPTGPGDPWAFLREIAAALEAVSGGVSPLPAPGESLGAAQAEAYRRAAQAKADDASGARRLPPLHALHCAARALALAWAPLAPLPFTEGMHMTGVKDHASTATLTLHMIVARLDPAVPRSRARTAIRFIREELSRTIDR